MAPRASRLMLAGTRAEVAQLNELARQSRLTAGEMGTESATNVQELVRQLKDKIASEVRDGLRGLWRLTGGLAAVVVLLLGWTYFHDPLSSRIRKLEQEAREQERMAVLMPYVKPDGKGGWMVRIQKGSVFAGPDGQVYARLPGQ